MHGPSRSAHFGTAYGGDWRPQGESSGQIVHHNAICGRGAEDWRENSRGSRGGNRGSGRTGGGGTWSFDSGGRGFDLPLVCDARAPRREVGGSGGGAGQTVWHFGLGRKGEQV